jgi:PAS domain-containing protein
MLESVSWEQVRKVFNSMPLRIVLLDREHRYRYLNPRSIEFIGRPENAILGRTIAQVLGEERFAITVSSRSTKPVGSWSSILQPRRPSDAAELMFRAGPSIR